ncbi:MAG: hypothetical protein II659_00975 [Bacteroidales bacterium]|nr:hypothetical protein [Bacteroidales bacterium]
MTTTFNANNFIKSFKNGYEAIPNHQGDQAAKVQVGDAIKALKLNPEVVLAYICDRMGNPSIKLSNEEWKDIIKRAIKNGDLVGKCLEVCAAVENGSKKVSYEDLFSAVVSLCGGNPNLLLQELYLNQVGWNKVADALVKTEVETEVTKTGDTKTDKAVAKKEESSIKTPKVDPRSKSITLVNDATGEVKTWPSYRACEKDLYGETGGHGCVSQLLDPKKGLKHLRGGWSLPKEEVKTPGKVSKHTRKRAILQMKKDAEGNNVVVNTFGSITEASKATGISHSGICKSCCGTYRDSGGYIWKYAESAA